MIVVFVASVASASSAHVRVLSEDPAALAWTLHDRGFDVVEGSVAHDSLELVVTASQRASLTDLGLGVQHLRTGGPLPGRSVGYPPLHQVIGRLESVAAAHPHIARTVDLTEIYGLDPTYEGRPLVALVLSDNVAVDEGEPAVQLLGGLHAREVVTPLVVLHAIDELIEGYGLDPDITKLVDAHEIWAVPVFNPDGYAHVFSDDDLWRKNRRVFEEGIGVDLNRNYDFEWAGDCPGSSRVTSNKYRGPGPASESETQVQVAWSRDRRFAKVLEFHSFGRKVLWGYSCSPHPFDAFLESEAKALGNALGWGEAVRPPSAEGEHFEWQIANGAHAMLLETAMEFQPHIDVATHEAQALWPGILAFLQRPISVHGTVTDAVTGGPVVALASLPNPVFQRGEGQWTTGPWGRYHHTLPEGTHALEFAADGYVPSLLTLEVGARSEEVLDVRLWPQAGGAACHTSRGATSFFLALFALAGVRRRIGGRRCPTDSTPRFDSLR